MRSGFLPLALLLPAVALAEAPQLDEGIAQYRALPRYDALTADVYTDPNDNVTSTRSYMMEIGFRSRFITVPKSILDIWFFNEDDPGWPWVDPRPRIRGYALGLEFVVKGETANGIFYLDYLDSSMKQGYWDDIEEPADHLDGDYLRPSENLGIIAFGADYAYEAHIIRTNETDGAFGLSFLVGGGLGMGVMIGKVDRWGPDGAGRPAYDRFAQGEPADDDKRIPKIYPMVDINAGLRFNFGDRVVMRLEGGLHTLFYYGASMGLMF